jgi:hypothetical protein
MKFFPVVQEAGNPVGALELSLEVLYKLFLPDWLEPG